MLLTTFLVCATLVAPSLGRLVASDQLAESPFSFPIPKLFDFEAAAAEVVANHVESPEAAPSPATDFPVPIIVTSRDGMAHPLADSRLLTGVLELIRLDMAEVGKELASTNVSIIHPPNLLQISKSL